ncbi:MAG: hypothetical protein Q9226_005553 [Calogaya cf. arnoldii]
MKAIKITASSPPPASPPHIGTAPSTQSQPFPTLCAASPTASTPQNTRAQKRKLDAEDGPTRKRLHMEKPPASIIAVAPGSSETTPDEKQDAQDHKQQRKSLLSKYQLPKTEGSQTQQDPQVFDSSLLGDDRDQDTDRPYHEPQELPSNQPRQSSPAELSKANLKKLQQEVAALEGMGDTATSSSRGQKRAPSRQTSNSELTSGCSKEPTPSFAFYRFNILRRARIQIHPEPPPKSLQPQLNVIFKCEVTKERMREIQDIAKARSEIFCDSLGGAAREDDLVEVAHEALFTMHSDRTLIHCRKAGMDPRIPYLRSFQRVWDLTALDLHPTQAADSADGPNKRHQADRPFPSPDTSQSTMPPPPPPAAEPATEPQYGQDGAVKTPRPDFTCGLRNSTVTKALLERGLSQLKADNFLEALQLDKRLCSNPTQPFLELRFPIYVIEGKAYSTGKTLFEAENQAAVSGSSMLIMQRQLTNLHDSVLPNHQERKSPLAFSVCTAGPILELWVHHLETSENITRYHMNIMATCHGSLSDELERFFLKVDCLIRWYKHEFLGEIADQLFAVANHVAR